MAALCSMHQITNSPISIPEPIYQASEWAKRGRTLWQAYECVCVIVWREVVFVYLLVVLLGYPPKDN
ncbi:hypothetical protein WR25_17241 [Diploscapter pachys]|uniref:Uncharacterized protein n=1 Tax=Diploscapter pachys TaxID=2018661 RepID=A0A2A2LVE4_9BILA|nr:hypothetical protein WR25_17241 [Diploscapter pachys]